MKRTEMYMNDQYLQQHPGWDGEEAVLKAGWINEMIIKHRIPANEIVEAGCGSGRILAELAKAYPTSRLTGYDISPKAIAIAKELESENISFYEADMITAYPGKADLLLLIDVLEHVPDYYGLLEGLHAKASYFIFHIPLDLSCQSLLKSQLLYQQRQHSGHIHYFSKEMVMWMLHDTGYQVMDWSYTKPVSDSGPNPSVKGKTKKALRNISFNLSKEQAVKWWGGYSMLIAARPI
ncbi:MAG TPA: class I SAM-dependent methyltransferase [Chitinophagaceae bacterium]